MKPVASSARAATFGGEEGTCQTHRAPSKGAAKSPPLGCLAVRGPLGVSDLYDNANVALTSGAAAGSRDLTTNGGVGSGAACDGAPSAAPRHASPTGGALFSSSRSPARLTPPGIGGRVPSATGSTRAPPCASGGSALGGGSHTISELLNDELHPWPPRRPSPNENEDLTSFDLLQGALRRTQAIRGGPKVAKNAECPFLHEPMESSSAVDLRCGHRFALVRLGAARRAAQLCCAAGYAQQDALICPLCGDQAGTRQPGAEQTLTTYSTNADAYIGDFRRDWQMPLQLPAGQPQDAHAVRA